MSDKGVTRRQLLAFWRRPAERPPARGKPVISAERCIAFHGQFCDACNRACPVPSVILFNNQGHPRVELDRCITCGDCEQACPTDPPAIALPLGE